VATRVFLSSRFEEFEHLRFGLKNSPDNDFEFVELDDGRAETESPLRRSLQALEECELVVLLLGTSIGAPVTDDLSIVELEWQVANELAIPCLHYFTSELRNHLKNPDGTLDARLITFAERVMSRGHVVGELFGDDSAKVLADVRRRLQGKATQSAATDAAQIAEFSYDGGFLNTITRKSLSYGLPLGDQGPDFQKDLLNTRASSYNALQRRMPDHAFQMMRDAVQGKNRVDLSSVWFLGELMIRYRECLTNTDFSSTAVFVADLLRRQATSIPIGEAINTEQRLSRQLAVLSTRSRLLLVATRDAATPIAVEQIDDTIRDALDKCWAELRDAKEVQLHRDDKDEFVTAKLRLAALEDDQPSLREIFFSIWHWKPRLALDSLVHLPAQRAGEIVDLAVGEAVVDFKEIFGVNLTSLGKKTDVSPRVRLATFRREVRTLVEQELRDITMLLIATNPSVVARITRLLTALRFPSVYLPRYQPTPKLRRRGDIFRVEEQFGVHELVGYPLGIYNLAVDGCYPLHWYDENPDLQDVLCILRYSGLRELIASPSEFLEQKLTEMSSIDVVRAEAATHRAAAEIDPEYRADSLDKPRDIRPTDRVSEWSEAWWHEVGVRRQLKQEPRELFAFEQSLLNEVEQQRRRAQEAVIAFQQLEFLRSEQQRRLEAEVEKNRAQEQRLSELKSVVQRLVDAVVSDRNSLSPPSHLKVRTTQRAPISRVRLTFLDSIYGRETLRRAHRQGSGQLLHQMLRVWLFRIYNNYLEDDGRLRVAHNQLSGEDCRKIHDALLADLVDYQQATLEATRELLALGSLNDDRVRSLWQLLGLPGSYESP